VENEALDIYAKVEDLLGVKDVAPKLYSYYFSILEDLHFNSLLDIGCGSGDFLRSLAMQYPECSVMGIDRSQVMVESAQAKGVNAVNIELDSIEEKFDIATATFDMVNYLSHDELLEFFDNLAQLIPKGGYFIFDINSEYGLSELAVGSFIEDDGDRFIAIESFYEDGIYDSEFILFEKCDSLYKKSIGNIKQYLHNESFFREVDGWKLKEKLPIKLYDMQEYDKEIYILERV
jgi:SAM-dependent methyltransferase